MRSEVVACLSDLAAADGRLTARVAFPAALPVFAGHFPGRPLVPGVFLIEAARSACEQALGTGFELGELREARFTREVGPDDQVTLEASWRETGTNAYDCEARLSVGGEPAARIRMVLHGEDGGDGCSASS